MEKIQLVFLGTGSAIPTLTRNHSAIFLRYRNRNFLIDCGEGTQRQIRKARINPCKITDILITHFHGDHFFGLPGLLHTLSKNNYSKTLNIYGPRGSGKFFKKVLEISGTPIRIKFHEVRGKFIENEYFEIFALPLNHDISCNGYFFKEKSRRRIKKQKIEKIIRKLRLKGSKEIKKISDLVKGKDVKINNKIFRLEDLTYLEKGRKISFVFDTKLCKNVYELSKNSDLAVIEASFLDRDKGLAKKYKHLTVEEAAKIAKISKVKKLILTHLSQRYEYEEDKLLKIARNIFPKAKIARDFMEVEV